MIKVLQSIIASNHSKDGKPIIRKARNEIALEGLTYNISFLRVP